MQVCLLLFELNLSSWALVLVYIKPAKHRWGLDRWAGYDKTRHKAYTAYNKCITSPFYKLR